MKRVFALLAVVAVLSATATGVLVWRLTRHQGPGFPEISAFTDGQLTRIGPYRYCDVHLKACDVPATTGELHVTARHPIQLSVPQPVARAPWVLLLAYEDGGSTVSEFRPNQRLAVTIPTVDPHHGKLLGLAVQLPTLARDSDGNEFPLPHAEWSVRTVWP
ncbi:MULTISPECIES: DUF2771 domain-containing protein [Mycolicibacterium]|uniref:DUF2771 domain-containing protein n=1 Tax=Mycolicibacterium TaxID=1866885 RepID=UPI00092B5252|nr:MULTISPECIES: DUF2771 domain-containing protein [Mycolicibacterium]RUP33040.1 MAG: DUF2771 domain-containing protein [Mycolicibacterium sp.]UCZ61231.1 DUF2771 domain-containing protein [Mycolicibacterium phocaicum]SHW73442.1 Protein of uncharacterised function (DUF2771) [Mycobacteroides abscessus subsp. abscessus]